MIFQIGEIRLISENMVTYFFPSKGEKTVSAKEAVKMLEPVGPMTNDAVKIISGKQSGKTGILTKINNEEGEVKLDSGKTLIYQLNYLCRIANERYVVFLTIIFIDNFMI